MEIMMSEDKPIIGSLMDVDFYKFTMGQEIFMHYPDVDVVLGLTNRTTSVRLGEILDISQVREELDHVRTLSFGRSDLHYLRGTDEYQDRMFREPYLQHLAGLQLPDYELEVRDGQIHLRFPGKWSVATHWETISLSIIAELYARYQLSQMTRLEKLAVTAQGTLNLLEKVRLLKQNPGITFIEFGTRRRFSAMWQQRVVEVLKEELSSSQFLGTSNTLLAMKLHLLPMGTSAHERDMALAAILGLTDEGVLSAIKISLNQWWEVYGEGLSVALTDTFGTDAFFRAMTRDQANNWKGLRQDSGNPFEFADRAIAFYKSHSIDPTTKLAIFSDGLDIHMIIKLYEHCRNRIKATFGWGTNLTNDLGLKSISLVNKLIEAMGRPTVKLSDNLAKAIGPADEIARYKRIFGYDSKFTEKPTY